MKQTKETTHTPKELLAELQALVAEAETMMVESLSEHSADALDKLRERFGVAQERASEIYESTKKRVAAGAKQTDAAIRDNPYQSLAIALGVGMLLGVLLGRRSK
jgi:ElaB/YqjD/DUF883 family membrane-anchored ribosome-binding protein